MLKIWTNSAIIVYTNRFSGIHNSFLASIKRQICLVWLKWFWKWTDEHRAVDNNMLIENDNEAKSNKLYGVQDKCISARSWLARLVPLELGLVGSLPRKHHYVIFPKIPFNYIVFSHKRKKSNRLKYLECWCSLRTDFF